MTVHVVDNASGDGTADAVAAGFPWVRLTALDHNAGFARANNLVLGATGGDYALVLNPDTELRPGVLDHVIGVLEQRPDAGMVGCRLVQHDGTFDHAAKRSFPTPVAALAHFTRLGRAAGAGDRLAQYRAPDVPEEGAGEVDAVNGAFMLVRRAAMRDVGLFDEGYWLYMEDLDWCARFWERGWKVLYDGTVTAIHAKGASSGKRRRLRQNWAFHRGMGRFYRRFQAGRRPAMDLAVYAGVLAKFGLSAARSATGRAADRYRR